jgi:hypothetical protein
MSFPVARPDRRLMGRTGKVPDMSFPVARPDRRLMGRKRRAEPCVVSACATGAAPAQLLQLDPTDPTPTRLRITLAEGRVVFGETIWRMGDVIGVRRSRGPAPAPRIPSADAADRPGPAGAS